MPYFAWLQVYPPHTWYLPPEPYIGQFGDANQYNSDMKQEKITNRKYPPEAQPQIDMLRKRYDEFILYSDKQFEIFMSRLSGTVDLSNTIIILTSDHGESFSHGYQEHDGPYLFDQFVHVPLIINIPERTEGDVIDVLIEQTDIAPTILELAGIPTPEWMEGRSFVPLLNGAKIEQKPVFSMQLIRNRSFGHPIEKGTVAVWDEDNKLIYYLEDEKTLLFDLSSDPEETIDLSEKEPEIRERLLKLIKDNLTYANQKILQSMN
jgi:arylsulfatase A-like enzyme